MLDIFGADRQFGERSREALRKCLAEGSLIACEIVWAETAAFFPRIEDAHEAMERLRIEFVPMDHQAALQAGSLFKEYRRRGGKRDRIIADFLIGAHAWESADRLLSRDRGFYRASFRKLSVLDPSKKPR